MKVTRFNYPLENSLIKKLNMMIQRCIQRNPKKDAVLLIEGAEGEGKTSLSTAVGYYVSEQTNRQFAYNNVFSDLDKMINFLQDREGLIAIWDEPALQALSGDSLSRIVKDLKRMLMMCRNKRHFIIINMTYFTEFGNYIVWQRPLGMIHVYSRNEIEPGRFIYIKKKNLERLWLDWKNKKKRNYVKYGSHKCRGTFPDVLNPDYKFNVLSEFDFKLYEKNKNEAIASIGKEVKKINPKEIRKDFIKEIIIKNQSNPNGLTNEQLSNLIGVPLRTFVRYKSTCKIEAKARMPLNNNMGNIKTINQNLEPLSND